MVTLLGHREEKFSDLVGMIYDSAMQIVVWPDLLRNIAEFMESKTAVFRVSDILSDQVHMGFTFGHEEYYLKAYRDYYIHQDPYRPFLKQLPSGIFYPGQVAMPYAEMSKQEFYQDLFVRNGIHYTLGGFALRDQSLAYQIVVQRGTSLDDYTEEEISGFNRLIPHLQRAFKINQQLASLIHDRQMAELSLDQLSSGVLLCDEEGKVCYLNQSAEKILAGRHGLNLVSGRLSVKRQQESGRLQQMIRNAISKGSGSEAPSGAVMTLAPESSTERPLSVLIAPLSQQNQQLLPFLHKRACAMVLVGPQTQHHRIDSRLVAMLFGLTEAEARLATELAKGKSVEEICKSNRISYHTGRSQLKSIFSKTGTRRQAELVNLILTSPAAI